MKIDIKIKQLEEKINELKELRKEEYSFMLNNCYKVSDTCYIKVDEIDFVFDTEVYVNGLVLNISDCVFGIRLGSTKELRRGFNFEQISQEEFNKILEEISNKINSLKL